MSETPLKPDELKKIAEAIVAGRKGDAEAMYARITVAGGADARMFVEKLAAQLRAKYPDRFAPPETETVAAPPVQQASPTEVEPPPQQQLPKAVERAIGVIVAVVMGLMALFVVILLCWLVYQPIKWIKGSNKAQVPTVHGSAESPPPAETWRDKDNHRVAYRMGRKFVEQRLKAPASAKWPGLLESEEHIKRLPDQRYSIDSWVDSQNSFGAILRQTYTCIVQQVGDSEWKLEKLEFIGE